MKKNKKAPARHKAEDDYLLTTKLFCGICKAMMVGESGTSGTQGRKYHYYRCVNSKKRKTCTAKHKSVRKEPLEQAVVSSVMRNIMDDAFVEYFVDQALALQGQESNELPSLRRQLADTEKAIDNMLNAIQAGIFNASTKRRLDDLEATKEKLELSIIKEEMKKPQFTREQIQFYILQYRKVDTNTLEGRRRLIDGFVNSVVVYDDYILVTFNYKEGAERITFEQIERSDLSSLGGPTLSEKPSKMTVFLHLTLDFIFIFELWRCHMGVASVSEYVASLNEEQQDPSTHLLNL
nr:zinc ribbon domain-containing protein [Pseudoflavonifractor phocaeensis]